jgi:hypothetical protein
MSLRSATLALICLWTCTLLYWSGAQAAAPDVWWSLRPLAPPILPQVQNQSWIKTPIDRFILAKLEAEHLQPNPPADQRLLLRRVYLDLTGLPPTPEELQAFAADHSANAYEKIVDRLLASPRYGERMARRWMDLIHFAESHGHDEDKHREHAWPYRDYLIRAFNADKPYAQLVREQVAGDALFPHEPDGIVALGMLAAGPWDQSSQMGIMDGTLDKQIARYLDRDDMITTVMSSFTSMTVHCARCHDHKFDPITMEDYYALQAVFAGVERVNREYDLDPQVNRRRLAYLQEKKQAEKTDIKDADWLSTESQARAEKWEKSLPRWQVCSPQQLHSQGGAALEVLPDLSVRSGGKRPDIDTVTLFANTSLVQIAAIRLELLTDPSLPHQGPGRQDNGNLHLSEFRASLISADASKPEKAIKLDRAGSDYDQPGWTAAMALDGNLKTAWGIYPQVGKAHVAVFACAVPVAVAPDEKIKFTLEQQHGGGHLLGRFRLFLAAAAPPGATLVLAKDLTDALACEKEKRSDQQKKLIARQARWDELQEQLKALPPPQQVYSVASDFPADGNFKPPQGPRKVELLRRGDVKQPVRSVPPGALSCIQNVPARFILHDAQNEAERRVALARWLTHPNNPLPWRSMANRLWLWNFGQGLVASPNDFGKMGVLPSHPELLDWLAGQLRDGVSIKTLQKMLVCSATYRQSSAYHAQAAAKDPTNQWLAQMNRTRLDAEEVRDGILQVSGTIDLTMFGPSVKLFKQKPGLHVTPVADYDHFDVDSPGAQRRSIYRFIFRTVPDPLMDVLDCPDASQLAPRRSESTTALQALTLLNHPFMTRMSEHLAARVQQDEKMLGNQINRLYRLVLLRAPAPGELKKMVDFTNQYGLANACRVLLNTNEFHFVE